MIDAFILRSIFLFGIIISQPEVPVQIRSTVVYYEMLTVANDLNLDMGNDYNVPIEDWQMNWLIDTVQERYKSLQNAPAIADIPKINRVNLLAEQALWKARLKWLEIRRPLALHKLELYNEEIVKTKLVLQALDYLNNATTQECTSYFRRINFKKYIEIVGDEILRKETS